MKYKNWLLQWMKQIRPTIKISTFDRYSDYLRMLVVPNIGDYDLNELTESVLLNFVAEISAKYATNTVKNTVGLVNRSILRANNTGVATKCRPISTKVKKKSIHKINFLSKPNQKKLERYVFDSIEQKPKLFGIIISLYTGLRIGELCALEWSDIDLKEGTIFVNKNCGDKYEGGEYKKHIGTPKTFSSRREIPIPKQLLPQFKKLQKSSVSTYVIEGKNGKVVPIRSYQNTFESVLKRLEMRHMGFHSLRHTFVTRALECGVDIKTLSEILGHSDPSITLKYYAHCLPEHKSEMMNKVGKLLQ